MKAVFTTARAVGTEFIRRFLKPVCIIGGVVLVVLLTAGIWLVTAVSGWWWFLLAPVILIGLFFTVLVLAAGVLLQLADPVRHDEQKRAVRNYVDKLQRAAESLQTPQYVILYRVVRDVVRPRPDSFIETLSRDSRTLAPDFRRLTALFE